MTQTTVLIVAKKSSGQDAKPYGAGTMESVGVRGVGG
jgi:hypothetical protein